MDVRERKSDCRIGTQRLTKTSISGGKKTKRGMSASPSVEDEPEPPSKLISRLQRRQEREEGEPGGWQREKCCWLRCAGENSLTNPKMGRQQ